MMFSKLLKFPNFTTPKNRKWQRKFCAKQSSESAA